MSDRTLIEWSDATWNVITGCSRVSRGCGTAREGGCYAERLAATRLKRHPSRKGLTRHGRWTGEVRFNGQWLDQPLRWRKPRRIFVCAHSDLFHEKVPEAWVDRVFAVMALCPRHTFQVLTKRPERARAYLQRFFGPYCDEALEQVAGAAAAITGDPAAAESVSGMDTPLGNVWLGTSVEDQRTASERIPLLLETPVALRWISAEPLLGEIRLRRLNPSAARFVNALIGYEYRVDGSMLQHTCPRLGWVVCGGESGPRARSMHPDWARRLRDDCAECEVPFFFKQWGGRTSKAGGRMLDGRTWDGMPRQEARE